MQPIRPDSLDQLASLLGEAAAKKMNVRLGGAFSKNTMGGTPAEADRIVSTSALNRVLEYEPRDLTISVEAGMAWAELERVLAENRQMIPLDPPFGAQASVGGVVAVNASGPRRRLYGTARDLIIGMKFATMAGEVITSGGMVVKNVAGLDMAKLLVGSFGTLAAIGVVNFRLVPMAKSSGTFLLEGQSRQAVLGQRNRILTSVLQPSAVDLLTPPAAGRLGRNGWILALDVEGTPDTVDRYARELDGFTRLDEAAGREWWAGVREFTPRFLAAQPSGAVVRVSASLQGLDGVLEEAVPAVARAANGVAYLHAESVEQAAKLAAGPGKRVVEHAPPGAGLERWPAPGNDLPLMEKVKAMFDPQGLLNRGRLYGRI
jgi:glycolate oxidase FAD binding subunit